MTIPAEERAETENELGLLWAILDKDQAIQRENEVYDPTLGVRE